jgi:hypothetical protein
VVLVEADAEAGEQACARVEKAVSSSQTVGTDALDRLVVASEVTAFAGCRGR